jgi:hypothetical protein
MIVCVPRMTKSSNFVTLVTELLRPAARLRIAHKVFLLALAQGQGTLTIRGFCS